MARNIDRERERKGKRMKKRERERATETVSYQHATPRALNIVTTFFLELGCGREKLG